MEKSFKSKRRRKIKEEKIDNLDNNYKFNKNKVLNRVIENCDTYLYAQQKL